MNGLHEEGIFRINGSQNRTLKQELEKLFHLYYNNSSRESTEEIFTVLNKYNIYDICSVLKQFIRELPDPLLTQDLLEAFILVPKITDFLQQIQVLNLLILLINDSHRNTLEAILYLFNDIANHEQLNKMTVNNIATIMAPNLFPDLALKKRSKQMEGMKEMESIMERAKDSFYITKTLIFNHLVLFHVPPYLIAQIQRRRK
ncbi:unnamed protein product [Medioppia subpectinata]|uniref:Rho-GAP domain-containing protein n=1 Tax=Medioppia subpectinata TaxID=1979941 RepID=A0A7R9KY80_9ACAR|nr:unnamed protein product [Medioppia subpectinata]CAG2111722.1 unnamed protein product [Medioppia subpectinata]